MNDYFNPSLLPLKGLKNKTSVQKRYLSEDIVAVAMENEVFLVKCSYVISPFYVTVSRTWQYCARPFSSNTGATKSKEQFDSEEKDRSGYRKIYTDWIFSIIFSRTTRLRQDLPMQHTSIQSDSFPFNKNPRTRVGEEEAHSFHLVKHHDHPVIFLTSLHSKP